MSGQRNQVRRRSFLLSTIVLPSSWKVATAIVAYFIADTARLLLWIFLGEGWETDFQASDEMGVNRFLIPRVLVLCACSILYGIHRVQRFHPIWQTDYCKWLASTPWTERQSLPMGPLLLVPMDALVIGLMASLLAFSSPIHPAMLITLFLWSYLGMMAWSLFRTNSFNWAFAITAIIAISIRCAWISPIAALLVGASAYPLLLLAVERSLAKLPWDDPEKEIGERAFDPLSAYYAPNLNVRKISSSTSLGAPNLLVSPKIRSTPLSKLKYTLIAILCGAYVFALAPICYFFPDSEVVGIWVINCVTCILSFCRVIQYTSIHKPPISLAGRIMTGRWIIPDYDQIFISPLCATFVGLSLPFVLLFNGFALDLLLGISITCVLLLLYNLGPTLFEWQLTGNHRIVAPKTEAYQQI